MLLLLWLLVWLSLFISLINTDHRVFPLRSPITGFWPIALNTSLKDIWSLDHLTGLRWKRAKPTFTKKSYNNLSGNFNSDKIYKKFGIPDEVTQILIFGSYQTKLTWFTGLKGNLGANVSLDFTGDSLTGKSQYGLK